MASAVDKVKLAVEIGKIAWGAIAVPGELKEKTRWLQFTINNKTQFPITWAGQEYFDSGRFWKAPSGIDSVAQGMFSVCNKDNSVATGVSGGVVYKLEVPDGHSFEFALGFSNPFAGSQKASILLGSSAEGAYKEIVDHSTSRTHSFSAVTESGEKVTVALTFTVTPAQEAMLTITQSVTAA